MHHFSTQNLCSLRQKYKDKTINWKLSEDVCTVYTVIWLATSCSTDVSFSLEEKYRNPKPGTRQY